MSGNFRYFLQTIFSQFFIAVCQSFKTHVDQPIFWIQKLDKEGQSKQLHDAWIDLAQRIQKGSFLEQELVKCLMKWHGKQSNPETCWPQKSLDGVSLLHISASCGIKSILEFIASYNKNPNPPKGNGVTPIHSAARNGYIDIVKFLTSKVDNPNKPTNTGETPIYLASHEGHIDIVKFVSLYCKIVSKVENPNEPRNDGVTPIQIASQQGNIDIVEILSTYIKQ